ncbi:MAG: site-specific integrase [Motiliproteus sp.]
MATANTPISRLRQRFIDDMNLRKLSPKTQSGYIRAVKNLARYLDRSPYTATPEDLRRFQLQMVNEGVSRITLNATITALHFFFEVTLDRIGAIRLMSHVRVHRKLPVILSTEEVTRLIDAATSPKYKTALAVAYGAGLRISEVVSLKVGDIDGQRKLLRVDEGKGGKDRFAMLSPVLLSMLRDWWRIARTHRLMLEGGWLFPGQNPINPLSSRQLSRGFHAAATAAALNKHVSMHSLRHAFATHLLEQNVDIRVIQVLLGHKRLETTALYSQVATRTLSEVKSPLDYLTLQPPA